MLINENFHYMREGDLTPGPLTVFPFIILLLRTVKHSNIKSKKYAKSNQDQNAALKTKTVNK